MESRSPYQLDELIKGMIHKNIITNAQTIKILNTKIPSTTYQLPKHPIPATKIRNTKYALTDEQRSDS
ncbi:MAG: hypothetical protein AAF934_05715 [Bacteroidota bacterium]